jgi:hypothetical protein
MAADGAVAVKVAYPRPSEPGSTHPLDSKTPICAVRHEGNFSPTGQIGPDLFEGSTLAVDALWRRLAEAAWKPPPPLGVCPTDLLSLQAPAVDADGVL